MILLARQSNKSHHNFSPEIYSISLANREGSVCFEVSGSSGARKKGIPFDRRKWSERS